MPNLMHDLETLGTVPGCVPLSFGGVYFSTRERTLGDELYIVFNRQDCEDLGLFVQQDTLDWWMKQSSGARQVLTDAADKRASVPLRDALEEINRFVERNGGGKTFLYGNGADFDNPILNVAYHKVGLKPAWAGKNGGYFGGRCYRSLKEMWGLLGIPKPPAIQRGAGTHHNALDDAKAQALHAIDCVAHYRSFIHG